MNAELLGYALQQYAQMARIGSKVQQRGWLPVKHSIGALFALFTAASLLTACGAGTSSLPPGTNNNCGGPPVQLSVIYPIPNSRYAPGNLANIYVSTNGQLFNSKNNQYNFVLKQSNGSRTATGALIGINKSLVPRPHANPTYANPFYYASSIPGNYVIGRKQSVNLVWNVSGSGCTPNLVVSTFRTRR